MTGVADDRRSSFRFECTKSIRTLRATVVHCVTKAASTGDPLCLEQCWYHQISLSRARVAEEAAAAAVLHVLNLNRNIVGICEVQLRRPGTGCAAAVFHPLADVPDERRRRIGAARLDAVAFEDFHDGVRIEVLHPEAGVIHP